MPKSIKYNANDEVTRRRKQKQSFSEGNNIRASTNTKPANNKEGSCGGPLAVRHVQTNPNILISKGTDQRLRRKSNLRRRIPILEPTKTSVIIATPFYLKRHRIARRTPHLSHRVAIPRCHRQSAQVLRSIRRIPPSRILHRRRLEHAEADLARAGERVSGGLEGVLRREEEDELAVLVDGRGGDVEVEDGGDVGGDGAVKLGAVGVGRVGGIDGDD